MYVNIGLNGLLTNRSKFTLFIINTKEKIKIINLVKFNNIGMYLKMSIPANKIYYNKITKIHIFRINIQFHQNK